MKRALLLFVILAVSALAQTVTISVTAGGVTKTWTITLTVRTAVSDLKCDMVAMNPGDSTLCTVTINQAAPTAGFPVAVVLPTGFTGPSSVTVPSGATITTFVVTRTATVATMSPGILPASWTTWSANHPSEAFAELLVPCWSAPGQWCAGFRNNEFGLPCPAPNGCVMSP